MILDQRIRLQELTRKDWLVIATGFSLCASDLDELRNSPALKIGGGGVSHLLDLDVCVVLDPSHDATMGDCSIYCSPLVERTANQECWASASRMVLTPDGCQFGDEGINAVYLANHFRAERICLLGVDKLVDEHDPHWFSNVPFKEKVFGLQLAEVSP